MQIIRRGDLEMKSKKWIVGIISVLIFVFIVIICIINCANNDKFWEISIGQALTPTVAILIAFMATQFKTDERKTKEGMEKIVNKIQNIVSESGFYTFSKEDNADDIKKRTGITNRSLSNCIAALQKYTKKVGSENEVKYIDERFKEYKDLISEHLEDLEYLEKTESQFKRIAENISSKCDDIMVNLYT